MVGNIVSRIAVIAMLVTLPLLYQNCSTHLFEVYSPHMEAGGTGLDGMRYVHYDTCPSGQVGAESTITMPGDRSSATMIRQNCADLATPRPVPLSQMEFASFDAKVFKLNEKVFDEQTRPSIQRVTLQFCQSTDLNVQSFVWLDGDGNTISGVVVKSDGTNTGPLVLNSSGTPTNDYASSAGQNQMDLNLLTANVSYSINGVNENSNVTCNAQSVPAPGPKTALHALLGNETGDLGANLADVSSVSELNALGPGLKGFVWLNKLCNGADANFVSTLTPYIGNSKLYGFYLMDDPDPTGNYNPLCTPANLKAESDWIHANIPGAITFIKLMNMGSTAKPNFNNTYTPANSGIDYFGVSSFACRSELGGCDTSEIAKTVQAAVAAGVPLSQIIPVYQAFGGGTDVDDMGGSFLVPSVADEQAMLAAWGAATPSPAFDMTRSWSQQSSDIPLSQLPALQAVFTTLYK